MNDNSQLYYNETTGGARERICRKQGKRLFSRKEDTTILNNIQADISAINTGISTKKASNTSIVSKATALWLWWGKPSSPGK